MFDTEPLGEENTHTHTGSTTDAVHLLFVLVCPPGAACVQSGNAGQCQDDGASHAWPTQPRLFLNHTVPRADTHHVWYVSPTMHMFSYEYEQVRMSAF